MNNSQTEQLAMLKKTSVKLGQFLNKSDCLLYGPVIVGSKNGYGLKFEQSDPRYFELDNYVNQLKAIGLIDVTICEKFLGGCLLVICETLDKIIEKLDNHVQQKLIQSNTANHCIK